MDEALKQFQDRHALLLTELRRVSQADADEALAARRRELKGILKVVARDFLRENVDPEVTEEVLKAWLERLEAA